MSSIWPSLRNALCLLLAAGLGCVAAVAVCTPQLAKERQLLSHQRRFAQLPADRQKAVRLAYAAWSAEVHTAAGSPAQLAAAAGRRQQLTELHAAITADPQLSRTLDTFTQWWSNLGASDRDLVQSLLTARDADAVAGKLISSLQQSQRLIVDFSTGPFRFSRSFGGQRPGGNDRAGSRWLSNLELTTSQYAAILEAAVPASRLTSAQQTELDLLESVTDKLLYRSLLYLTRVRDGGPGSAYENLQPMIAALQSEVVRFNPEWSREFAGRVAEAQSPRGFFSRIGIMIASSAVPDQAVIDFGRQLRSRFVVEQNQLIDAFADAPDDRRRTLLTLPADVALERLQKFAVEEQSTADTPERRLYRSLLEYDEALMSFQRLFSFRPPSPPNGSSNGGPPQPPPPGTAPAPSRINGRADEDRARARPNGPPPRPPERDDLR